ncbi:MAG: hypothetical protein ACSHXK_03040 [Oceanococcus sp.]
MSTADKLLQAHVKFEIDRLTGKQSEADLAKLVDELWDWASKTTLTQGLDAETTIETTLRWVEQWYLPDTLTVLLGSLSKRLIHLPINQDTSLGDLIDDELFEAGIDLVIQMERVRDNLITQATQSPLYSMLISNVLYSGIRDYVASSSEAMQKKVPGMGLLSKGASALNKRVGLEAAVEDRLRGFIKSNAEKTIRNSRQFLLDALGPEQVRELANEIWAGAQNTQLTVAELLEDEEIDRLISFGLSVWQDLRQTEYIQELIREGINGFYDSYGDETLDIILEHLGLDRGKLREETTNLLPELLQNAKDNGLLELFLRSRLQAFYSSKACQKALQ